MEKSTKNNKRNRNRNRNDDIGSTNTNTNTDDTLKEKSIEENENSDKSILKKYMDTDIETLNPSELKKMKPFIEEIRETIKIFKSENFDALAKFTENKVKDIKKT
jgi:hypothetical protein